MGQQVDKIFLEIAGRPVLAHTWRQFERADAVQEIVIVIREGMENSVRDLAARFGFRKPFVLVSGGKERQDSVWNGLSALNPQAKIVAIQDAARPCTSPELITATIDAAREVGAAVAAQRVTDTIKESDGCSLIERTVDRSRLWSVQTPQTFRYEVLCRALEIVRRNNAMVTDDTAACELIACSLNTSGSYEPSRDRATPRRSWLPFSRMAWPSDCNGSRDEVLLQNRDRHSTGFFDDVCGVTTAHLQRRYCKRQLLPGGHDN
jgi:2-C-methyl-D-erythritol 4-phosphate cytidylyltransferase